MGTVVFYDGYCGLCDRFVRFLVSRDRARRLRFAPLQGPLARQALLPRGHDPADLNTIFVIAGWRQADERILQRSRAVLHAVAELGGGWRLLARVAAVVPSGAADLVYGVIARSRYRLFGRRETCALPPPEWREHLTEPSED